MGRMVGPSSAHDAMDNLMERMMGTEATEQMHVALGERSTVCGRGEAPRSFQNMMGAVGMMGLGPLSGNASRSSGFGPMMGGRGQGFGGMMGRYGGSGSDDYSNGLEIAVITMLGVLIALGIGALWLWRRPRRLGRGSALDILNERFAQGELDAEDYERRRRLLEAPDASSG
jgi:putative membrane protein